MQIRKYQISDLKLLYEFYNENCWQIDYCPFTSVDQFENAITKDINFKSDGLFIAFDGNKIIGLSLGIIQNSCLPNETLDTVHGYLCLLIVDKAYQKQGIGNSLLEYEMSFFKKYNRLTIRLSHKCPIKFRWKIPNKNAEHNKAPGIDISKYGYQFLIHRSFEPISFEISYYCDLKNFTMKDMLETKNNCAQNGYTICYFDEKKHHGYDDMFTRLKDESYRKKFHNGIIAHQKMLVAVKDNENVVGVAGVIYPEPNGRGYFQGLAIDPKYNGLKIGNLLFFSLCDELKHMGADYMTLFVSEDNFARRIYEKAGFEALKKWSILEMEVNYE